MPQRQRAELALYEQARARYTTEHRRAARSLVTVQQLLAQIEPAIAQLRQRLHVTRLDTALLRHPPPTDTTLRRLATALLRASRGRVAAADTLPDIFAPFCSACKTGSPTTTT